MGLVGKGSRGIRVICADKSTYNRRVVGARLLFLACSLGILVVWSPEFNRRWR